MAPREPAHFGRIHALGAHRGEQRARHRRGELARGQFTEQAGGAGFAEIRALQKMLEHLTRAHHRLHGAAREVFRKLPMSTGPSGVSTLSGWNCTPSIGSVRWRTPMISP